MPIPAETLTPFFYIDFSASTQDLGPTLQRYRALLIGQRTAAGTVAAEIPTKLASADDAKIFFGTGSILHRMAIRWFQNNRATEVWGVATDDDGGAAAATGTFTFTGPATANGTVYVYVGGVRFAVGVTSGDTETIIAAAVAAAINLDTDLHVTAGAAIGAVTLTAKNLGEEGNDIDLRANFAVGEFLPAGVGLVTVAMAGGATNPDITPVFVPIAGTQYHILAIGQNDQVALTAVDVELEARFGPAAAIDGYAIAVDRNTHANLITLGIANNSKHLTLMGFDGLPEPSFEAAAALAGVIALDAEKDPAKPFTGVQIKGLTAPSSELVFDLFEREALAKEGISTYRAGVSGTVHINLLVTTRTKTDLGVPDTSFRPLNPRLSLSYIRFDGSTHMAIRFARHKLANDGQTFLSGQDVATPSLIRSELIAKAGDWVALGIIENLEDLKAGIVVLRDDVNRDRANIIMPIDMMNAFLVGAFDVQFRL